MSGSHMQGTSQGSRGVVGVRGRPSACSCNQGCWDPGSAGQTLGGSLFGSSWDMAWQRLATMATLPPPAPGRQTPAISAGQLGIG